jgi:hypothetical protein
VKRVVRSRPGSSGGTHDIAAALEVYESATW